VFEVVYKASGGIPRRINSVCDRLLLLGFLSNRTHLTVDDITEVAREFEAETAPPVKTVVAPPAPAAEGGTATAVELDVDLSKLKLEMSEAEAISKQIGTLTADQRADQLQRLERSLLRLERINVQTLALMQKLVHAVKRNQGSS
jgi:general secretion pathway protein A